MKACINGEIVELTEEQIIELKNDNANSTPTMPTTEARLKALETAFADFVIQQAEVTSNG